MKVIESLDSKKIHDLYSMDTKELLFWTIEKSLASKINEKYPWTIKVQILRVQLLHRCT